MTRLCTLCLLIATLTACVGADAPDKLDTDDSAALVPDEVIQANYGLRCAIPEDGEECYEMTGENIVQAQPGEFFSTAGSKDCPLGDEPVLLVYANPGGRLASDGDGLLTVRTQITFDCGGVVPEDGELFYAEELLVGDLGTVILVSITGDYVAE